MTLEIGWTSGAGVQWPCGIVGEPTQYWGKSSQGIDGPIHIGDEVTIAYPSGDISGIVFLHWASKRPKVAIGNVLIPSDLEYHCMQKFKITRSKPFQELELGHTFTSGRDMNLVVRNQGVVDKPTLTKSPNELSVVNLATKIIANLSKFEPVEPTFELMYSLFGVDDNGICKYAYDRINPIAYAKYVKRWIVDPKLHIYLFESSPLAIIQLDESLNHGPRGHLNRIVSSAHFCEHANHRYGMFIEKIIAEPKYQSHSVLINVENAPHLMFESPT